MRTAALSVGRRQIVTLRLRATDRIAEAEVIDPGETTILRLQSRTAELNSKHFELGVDIEMFERTERYALENIEVVEFNKEAMSVVVRGPLKLRHVRRRANFRERVLLDGRICVYRGGGVNPEEGLGPAAVPAKTVDVGGGGISVETRQPMGIGLGDNVLIELDVDGYAVRAVARTAWIYERGSGRTTAGFAFIEIEERSHDRLYRFLYELQRRRRR